MNVGSSGDTAFIRIAANSLLLFSEGTIGRLSNFLFTLFVVRFLTISDFGIYSSVLGFVTVAMSVAEFGISNVVTRDIAQAKARSGELFSGAIVLAIPLCIFAVAGTMAVAILCGYNQSFVALLSLAAVGVLGNSLVLIAGGVLRALERMVFLSAVNSLIITISAVSGIVWMQYGAGVKGLVLLIALTPLANASVLTVYVIRRFARLSVSRGLRECRNVMRQAIPLAIFNLCAIILMRYDILLLSKTRGMVETGIFCASRNITDTMSLFILSVVGAAFPYIASRWAESREDATRNYEHTLRFFAVFGIAATCGIFFLSEKIVVLLYQNRYEESVFCLKILIWSFMFNALSGPVGMLLVITKDRLRHYIPYAIVVTVVNVMLNLCLTPKYGYVSASFIATFSSLLLFGFKIMALRDILPVQPRWARIGWRPVVAGLVMSGVLYFFRDYSLVALLFLGFLSYTAVLIGLGEFTDDYRMAMVYLRKVRP